MLSKKNLLPATCRNVVCSRSKLSRPWDLLDLMDEVLTFAPIIGAVIGGGLVLLKVYG
jgi:hypothetical protein